VFHMHFVGTYTWRWRH